jgi:leader peptidase (prepilin peptidase)/N-methyltransferase
MLGAFFGWHKLLLTVFLATLAGTLVGVGLIALRGRGLGHALPLGTFLGGAALVALFGGDPILAWYGDFFRG